MTLKIEPTKYRVTIGHIFHELNLTEMRQLKSEVNFVLGDATVSMAEIKKARETATITSSGTIPQAGCWPCDPVTGIVRTPSQSP